MAEHAIPVDLHNPGQVFACLGFLEAADVLLGDAEGGFDWSDAAHVLFRLRAAGQENPVAAVLEFLRIAEVRWLTHDPAIQERDGGTTIVRAGISDSSDPKSADLLATLVESYKGKEREIHFGYWADGSSRFNTTFKKSTNGASSHIRFGNALTAIKQLDREKSIAKPFEQPARTESLFRLDPRGVVDPIDTGTSPDKLRKGAIDMRVATYPICEALAVVGLQHARPKEESRSTFRYQVWSGPKSGTSNELLFLPPTLARAALAGQFSFLDTRTFLVKHEEVKKGGDRKMTNIEELKHG